MIDNIKAFEGQIDAIFAKGWDKSLDFDTQFVLNECKQYFDKHCIPGGKLDLLPTKANPDGNAELACRLYGRAAFMFPEHRLYAAESLLLGGWSRFNAIQSETGHKIYKGILAFALVQLYEIRFRDMGAAARWALLTHADDALVRHFTGMGRDRLQFAFGMSEEALEQFNNIVKPNILDDRIGGWSEYNRFADDILLEFILKFPQYAHLFTIPTAALEFPANIPYLEALCDRVKDSQSPSEKGDALERLAAYLFLLIPGLIPRQKVMPETADFENDLVVSNWRLSSNLEAELFGRDFLVECKNWERAVGVSQVGYFLYRMRLTHTRFGVIFAKNGITGNAEDGMEPKYAENLCQRAFHEDGSICIVIDGNDIKSIIDGEGKVSFRSLLMERSNQLRFGNSRI